MQVKKAVFRQGSRLGKHYWLKMLLPAFFCGCPATD